MKKTAENPILAATSPRLGINTMRQNIRIAWKEHEALLARRADLDMAYAGGLPAERQSHANAVGNVKTAHKANRSRMRAAYMTGLGRKIDLKGLLSQLDSKARPKWTIVDPRRSINDSNGCVQTRPKETKIIVTEFFNWPDNDNNSRITIDGGPGANVAYVPGGIPALPKRVRALIQSPSIRRRANRIGILYQPDDWTAIKPDPALVIEWKDQPGEYYALAVWGGDMPQIMEFVD